MSAKIEKGYVYVLTNDCLKDSVGTDSVGTDPAKPAISALSASLREKIRGDTPHETTFITAWGSVLPCWVRHPSLYGGSVSPVRGSHFPCTDKQLPSISCGDRPRETSPRLRHSA